MNGEEKVFFNDRFVRLEQKEEDRWHETCEFRADVKKDLEEIKKLTRPVPILEAQVAWLWALMILNVGAIGTGFWIMLRIKG